MTEFAPPGIQRTVRESQPLRRLHILFVDSDPNGREKIQQALGNSFTVQYATSVEQARHYLETQVPDNHTSRSLIRYTRLGSGRLRSDWVVWLQEEG